MCSLFARYVNDFSLRTVWTLKIKDTPEIMKPSGRYPDSSTVSFIVSGMNLTLILQPMRGRIRVKLFDDKGKPTNPELTTRKQLFIKVNKCISRLS
jgi:hypothetical protein